MLQIRVPWIIPLTLFIAATVAVFFVTKSCNQRRKMLHDERMLALEKGIELPECDCECCS